MKRLTSEQLLSHSIKTRLNHVMIDILSKFESAFPDFKDEDEGRLFRHNVKNIMNDAIRATTEQIGEYTVEYRPLRFNPDNTLSLSSSFLATVKRVEFGDTPSFRMYGAIDKAKIMGAIRAELGAGVVYSDGESLVFEVVGLEKCVDCVLPFLDRYRLSPEVKKEYAQWRESVVQGYVNQELGNVGSKS